MPINRPDKALEVRPGSLDATSMRYHELWLQRWLYSRFYVREGYPVPVVFATPMDAFSLFSKLWADDNNPFAYLFSLKDDHGTPLYEPHPSPVRYPLISVSRQGIKLRPGQNFSTHRWRHINWPTVSDTMPIPGKEQQGTDLTKCDLGEVMTSRMPMAFDYRFQIDHFCLRPDTQAFFIEKLLNQFWRSGGGMLQTWMDIEYPGWGQQYIRLYLEGDVDNRAPEEADLQEKNVEFRTSFTVVVEGFSIDVAYETVPALWKLVATSARIEDLDQLLIPSFTTDLRTTGYNYVLESRPDIPAAGTCQAEGRVRQYAAAGTQHIYFGDPQVPDLPAQNVAVPGPATGGNQPPYYSVIEPLFAYGIESTLVFGLFTVEMGTVPTAYGTEESSVSLGLLNGIYSGAVTVYTDPSNLNAGLLYGSYDPYIARDAAYLGIGTILGDYLAVSVPGGTFTNYGTLNAGFQTGTYLDVTVWAYGTDYGTLTVSAGTGTYAHVSVDGGTYSMSGSVTVGFGTGTYTPIVVPSPTLYQTGTVLIGFSTGMYA
jgi:hypothetical protein